ncbi:MAG: polysaccharide pyruvyl transferase CsaB [Cyanothece sp. SIO1E1]|nr:polysaccharide pyruvyl transferase CsaB [Cyanothece sp. SIO1E1]
MRAVLCGYYGKGNSGDEALLASLLQMLPAHVTPLVLSGEPKQTWNRYGVDACDRMSAFSVGQALRSSDALIWGGGSLMQDATSAISPFYYGGLMGLARGWGLRTIAWAQGIGPLQYPLTRWIAKAALQGCTAVSVRDAGSQKLLSDWQIPCRVAPDPVWALESIAVENLWDVPAPRVAVALRSHPWLTPERRSHLSQALVAFQQATQVSLVLLPFQPIQDLKIAQTIQSQLLGPSQILTLADPAQLKGLFRHVEMTIAMRYHALIMAAAEGCRCFALSYDPKVSRLMQELALPGWDLDPHTQLLSPLSIPKTADAINRTWLEYYAHGMPLAGHRIQSLITQALMHRELLNSALAEE